jgi:hypothetical protein
MSQLQEPVFALSSSDKQFISGEQQKLLEVVIYIAVL